MTKTCMMNYVGTNDNNVHPLSTSSVTRTTYFIHIDSVLSIFTYTIGKRLLERSRAHRHKALFDPTGLAPLLNLSTDTE